MKYRARFSIGSLIKRLSNRFFGTRDFPYLKLGIRDLIRASFGIEIVLGRWDAKNNPRDYGIKRNFESRLTN